MPVADFQNPKLTQDYTSLLQGIRDLTTSQAQMHDNSGVVNVPLYTIRFSSANARFEKYNGTAWVILHSTYAMNVTQLNGLTGSASATASTYVQRNTDGNAFVNYLNSSDLLVSSGLSGLMCKAGDNYIKTSNPTGVKTFLAYTGNEISALRTNAATDIGTSQEMRWKNYGNGYTIIDASAGTAPNGAAINNKDSTHNWSSTFPTLMGWNGNVTCGVRVDSCRISDTTSATTLGRVKLDGSSYGSYGSISLSGSTNGWAGLVLSDVGGAFMDSGNLHGYFRNNNSWLWHCDNAGNFTAIGDVTIYSDERLKEDWKPIAPDFLTRWAKVKHGTYTRKDTGERQAGLSAQDVQTILPELVQTSGGGMLSLAYAQAAALATVTLAAQLEIALARITALENK